MMIMLLTWLLCGLCLALPTGQDWAHCTENLPDSLSFEEPLRDTLIPRDIVIFSGGDSLERRTQGFGKITSEQLQKLAKEKGYRLVFLDELDYCPDLIYKDTRYSHHWQRVFAMPALRKTFPDAKYFVWLDDDILVPYPETDMINHYINMMEVCPEVQFIYGYEGASYVLNSGMFFMRNTDFTFGVYEAAKELGLENEAYLATRFGHEQGAIIEIRKRYNLEKFIWAMPHRHGRYNYNTFFRDSFYDHPDMRSRDTDAFIHFTGMNCFAREVHMKALLERVQEWRKGVKNCVFPIDMD